MIISAAGRVARAFITESEGVYAPDWTVEKVGEQIDAIRDPSRQVTFHPVPDGFNQHLGKSFEMAAKGG
jgi:hypothetical protein